MAESRRELIAKARKLVKQAAPEGAQRKLFELILEALDRPTGVFGDIEIREALASGQIAIDPFDEVLLNSSSYDVTLGENFYICEAELHQNDYSPYDEKEVRKYFKGPLKALPSGVWCASNHRDHWPGIEPDEMIIVLEPGECMLGHTEEFIGAFYGATTEMKARSSMGRNNISVCDDAGKGDVGYVKRWTCEIRNKNKAVSVPLIVGQPFAQISWLHVADSSINYADVGHYQSGKTLEEVKVEWKEKNMLPRLWDRQPRPGHARLSID